MKTNELPGWLLGDSGYPNLPHLLTPVNNPTTPGETAYNIAHRRTRTIIERAFGVLKGRFLALSHKISGPLIFTPAVACKIITCCSCLHNIAQRTGLPIPDVVNEVEDEEVQDNREEYILLNTGNATRARLINDRFV